MPQSKVRVVGSGFTTFKYRGQPIAFLGSVQDSGQPVLNGAQAEAIHPIGWRHPKEIVTGRVLDLGTLTLSIRELWNEDVWQQLAGLEGVTSGDITAVWDALAADPSDVTCEMVIKPPGGLPWRVKIFHNCVITDIDNSDSITVGGLSVARVITVSYTHKTYRTLAANGA